MDLTVEKSSAPPAREKTPDVDAADSPSRCIEGRKRKTDQEGAGSESFKADDSRDNSKKRAKTAPSCVDRGTNNAFRYWQIEVEDSSAFLGAATANVLVSSALSVSPSKVGLRFVKSMSCQQVRAMLKDFQYKKITRMECSAFRALDRSQTGKKCDSISPAKNKLSRHRCHHTNSYYAFTTVGQTFAERIASVIKVINMSPLKRPFSAAGMPENVVPPSTTEVSPCGIRDIHFIETDLKEGCFAVRSKINAMELDGEGGNPGVEVEMVELSRLYSGLLSDISKIDHGTFKQRIHQRNMRRHIKSWICICPFHATMGEAPSDCAVTSKGISSYRISSNNMGIFQFDDKHAAITPLDAAEAMGAMHKSLCFQSAGKTVKELLAGFEEMNSICASMGHMTYRSSWKNNTGRSTKYVKFYSIADDKKMTDQDILDVVNTDTLFHSIHFDEADRSYGVAKCCKGKIVPSTVVLPDGSHIRFTSITLKEFNNAKAARGMNCFNAWRKGPKATSFGDISGTAFSFADMPEESLWKMMAQKRVKMLKAVKRKVNYYGLVKTGTSVNGCSLSPNSNGKVIPVGKMSFQNKLRELESETLAVNYDVQDEVAAAAAATLKAVTVLPAPTEAAVEEHVAEEEVEEGEDNKFHSGAEELSQPHDDHRQQ